MGTGGEGRGRVYLVVSLCSLVIFFLILLMTILGDPGAVTWVDKMFVVNRRAGARLDLTVNSHHEHFIDPTNCPWVSEDAL